MKLFCHLRDPHENNDNEGCHLKLFCHLRDPHESNDNEGCLMMLFCSNEVNDNKGCLGMFLYILTYTLLLCYRLPYILLHFDVLLQEKSINALRYQRQRRLSYEIVCNLRDLHENNDNEGCLMMLFCHLRDPHESNDNKACLMQLFCQLGNLYSNTCRYICTINMNMSICIYFKSKYVYGYN